MVLRHGTAAVADLVSLYIDYKSYKGTGKEEIREAEGLMEAENDYKKENLCIQ